jgi:hypothetical protein
MPSKHKKSRPARPKKRGDAAIPRDPDAPHWIPSGRRWDEMPENIRQTVSRLLAPAYRRFVLDAPGELERSMGLTLVHLMWLEVCDQAKMAVVGADPQSLDAVLNSPEDMLDRHLRLTAVKCQTAELLMKLRMLGDMLGRPPRGAGCQPALAGQPAALAPHNALENGRLAQPLLDTQIETQQVSNLLQGGV